MNLEDLPNARAEALGAQLLEKPISIPRFRAAVSELLSREQKSVS